MAEAFSDRIADLERQYYENKGSVAVVLRQLREALVQWGARWTREAAKRIAVSENGVTISLGKDRIAELKSKLEDYAVSLPDAINDQFSKDPAELVQDASSGLVRTVLERRYEEAIRRILGGIAPIMRHYGYLTRDDWSDPDASRAGVWRYPYSLDLPPDIAKLMGDVIDLVTENKVIESKIVYFQKQGEKERARRIWENA